MIKWTMKEYYMKAEFVTLRRKYLENKFKNLNDMQVKAVLTTEGPALSATASAEA